MAPLLSRLVFISFAVTSGILQTAASCGAYHCCSPWHVHNDRCYLLVTDGKSFQDAETFCQTYSTPGRQAHLISVTTEDESAFLKSYVAEIRGQSQPYYLWIGYNDIQVDREFVWTDGSSGSYDDFAYGEPNHYSNEDCIALKQLSYWSDLQCRYEYEFVCEKPALQY